MAPLTGMSMYWTTAPAMLPRGGEWEIRGAVIAPPCRQPRACCWASLVILALVLGACSALPETLTGEAPPECRFPEGTDLAFAGDTTLRDLLNDAGPYRDLPGSAYVTAERVDAPGTDFPPNERLFCFVFAADAPIPSGVPAPNEVAYGMVPIDWQPPAP